jgi:xylose isomerase domain protein TIM barrel
MQVGISTATFYTKLYTEQTFPVIKKCGAEVCEVFMNTYSEYEPEFGDIFVRESDGLKIYSVHALNTQFEPQLFNRVDRTRYDAEVILKKVLANAQKMGAHYYTFHATTRLKVTSKINVDDFAYHITRIGDIAKQYNVQICLENVHWAAFNSPNFFRELKPKITNIGTVLDIKQARQSGFDWREYIDVMGNTIRNIHISDVKNNQTALVGTGEFPFKELIARLRDVGYDGSLIIEQYPEDYDTYDQLKDAVEFIKSLI